MAQRRMFSKEVTTSDLFVDMPLSSQLLYFHLGMEADDEGFIGNAKMLSRAYGTNNDDLKLLEAKGFLIIFPSGVTVVKDWNLNNQIRKDRKKPTIYTQERNSLNIDTNGSYWIENIGVQNDNQMTTKRQPNVTEESHKNNDKSLENPDIAIVQPNVNQVPTNCPPSIGEYSIDKDRLGEDSIYIEGAIPNDNQTTPSIDNDILFKNYIDLFINFAKKNINKRSLAQQTFIKLSEMEKGQIITGAKNYINFYKSDRPDDENGQYSINAYEFLDNAVFKEYQTPIEKDKSKSVFAKYDPNADINDRGGW